MQIYALMCVYGVSKYAEPYVLWANATLAYGIYEHNERAIEFICLSLQFLFLLF